MHAVYRRGVSRLMQLRMVEPVVMTLFTGHRLLGSTNASGREFCDCLFLLNDYLIMIRNYAKKPSGLFARMAAKIAAFTMLQYSNLLNHRRIGQVKYALL